MGAAGRERGHGEIRGASDSGSDIGAHWSVQSLSLTMFVRKWPRLNWSYFSQEVSE